MELDRQKNGRREAPRVTPGDAGYWLWAVWPNLYNQQGELCQEGAIAALGLSGKQFDGKGLMVTSLVGPWRLPAEGGECGARRHGFDCRSGRAPYSSVFDRWTGFVSVIKFGGGSLS